MSIWDTASAAIDAAFAVPGGVTYSGVGIALDGPIVAIREDDPGVEFQGPGSTTNTVGYEIKYAVLPREPRKGDQLVDGAETWRVIERRDRPAVKAWLAIVEKAS